MYWGMEVTFPGLLFDVLQHFGMTINIAKTAAIFESKGKLQQKVNRRYIRRTKDGTFLMVPRRDGSTTDIKLKSAHLYLLIW